MHTRFCLCPTIEPLATLVPPYSHRGDNPQTGEQLYQSSSYTVAKVLGPTTDSPTWGSSRATENPEGMWLWRPEGFDYRTSTGLGKQTIGGHKQLNLNLNFNRVTLWILLSALFSQNKVEPYQQITSIHSYVPVHGTEFILSLSKYLLNECWIIITAT